MVTKLFSFRNLKSSLLDAERYKEEFREISEIIAMLKKKMRDVQEEINRTKAELQKARLEGAMPKSKYYAPKFNKDTKVNLDMSMWITHNISKEEQEPYQPEIKYYEATTYKPYEAPTTYKPEPEYKPEPTYKYEEPEPESSEEAKYEVPKYTEPEPEPEVKY